MKSVPIKREVREVDIPSPTVSRSPSFSYSQRADLQTERVMTFPQLDSSDETLSNVTKLLNRSRKIAVLTGAGISCNAGIPDFRSSNGLYDLVKNQFPELTIRSGQEMFDISLFRDELKISVFATFMEKLYSSVQMAKPTKTHRFIAHLKNRNKLLRCYTQNIDGLEETLGLIMSRDDENRRSNGFSSIWKNLNVVQLHGDLNTLACTKCFTIFEWNRFRARSFRRGELPCCPSCEEKNFKRLQEGKRSIDSVGFLRPNIVLYGENHPTGEFIAQGLSHDIAKGKPDFLIIMGTSLKVDGVKKLVKHMSKQVHERGGVVILINKTILADSAWAGTIDYQICSDCDSWVSYLEKEIPDFFKTQEQIDKLRQLKREASELRKQKKLLEQQHSLSSIMKTPPTTPTGKDDHTLTLLDEDMNQIKRKLINEDDQISNKKFKTSSS
ncbi:hypothetical protein Kpol_495p15 [Vanderwaltozyma polyspora DSM 70294]|uniref:Deacetylase sirtuin-type domain-containing protein n=1 Tax=Vanderwaltozyma polyspora (strain ATCC 22028 / DSM 70294 / BCRC 21397 / CBS 2163 / NBRC 10782 / NRRL Y-8283 / UCD 57-17) TaxID=436907 RepID=A7TNZ2_VANPO|nr:uncharacterized protein Kpol_495p15 [Vanderwaltozyma polyspora DSM 70294]EDO16017.1 hypothetical protein Kpol_495p15 [Vanderwaltozyma polyspora DSM 70294]